MIEQIPVCHLTLERDVEAWLIERGEPFEKAWGRRVVFFEVAPGVAMAMRDVFGERLYWSTYRLSRDYGGGVFKRL